MILCPVSDLTFFQAVLFLEYIVSWDFDELNVINVSFDFDAKLLFGSIEGSDD